MIVGFNHFYDVFRKNEAFFSIFPVILVSEPMKMAKTDFPTIYIYTYIGQC